MNESLAKLTEAELHLEEKQLDALFSVVVKKDCRLYVFYRLDMESLLYTSFFHSCSNNYSVSYSSSVLLISPLNALMMEEITKLEDFLTVTVMESLVDGEHDIASSTGMVYTCERKPTQIVFAHPEAVV